MRLIEEFRGWDSFLEQWVYGDLTHSNIGNTVYINGTTVDPKKVGQFTGMTLEDDTKIWKGDILEFSALYIENDGVVSEKYTVLFNDGAFETDRRSGTFADKRLSEIVNYAESTCNPTKLKIIGNIHENPELLEAK